MKPINVVSDFNQIKIAQERHVNDLIKKIKDAGVVENEKHIELNLEGCITDYPATPRLIDYFLEHLSGLDGDKSLYIKLDGLGNKLVYILYILVLEGHFFGISDKVENENEVDKWVDLINQKLKEKNITLKILFTPNGSEYNYGK